MSKNRVRFYIVLAVVLAIFSAIAFVAPFSHSTVFWLSYAFGVVAIAVQAYSWPKAFSGAEAKRRRRSGAASCGRCRKPTTWTGMTTSL